MPGYGAKTHNGRNLDAVMTNSKETMRKYLHHVKCPVHSVLTRSQTSDSMIEEQFLERPNRRYVTAAHRSGCVAGLSCVSMGRTSREAGLRGASGAVRIVPVHPLWTSLQIINEAGE